MSKRKMSKERIALFQAREWLRSQALEYTAAEVRGTDVHIGIAGKALDDAAKAFAAAAQRYDESRGKEREDD